MARGSAELGSVLMLVPAAVLVLIVLGAIAVDSAAVLLAQRQLANQAAAAGNDIAAVAVVEQRFYDGGEVELSQEVADSIVRDVFAQPPRGFISWTATATVSGPTVVVEATGVARHVFAPAVPGVRRTTVVRARTVATATPAP